MSALLYYYLSGFILASIMAGAQIKNHDLGKVEYQRWSESEWFWNVIYAILASIAWPCVLPIMIGVYGVKYRKVFLEAKAHKLLQKEIDLEKAERIIASYDDMISNKLHSMSSHKG